MPIMPVEQWLKVTPEGLFCVPGGFHIDPSAPVARAVITHGHSDHARSGHGQVLTSRETAAIMQVRYGVGYAGAVQVEPYGRALRIGEVAIRLLPAGHILGSAQVAIDHAGSRVVISGDYKRRRDPTCPPFEVMPCDLFITEATFGLPVFRHPPDQHEIARLLKSVALYPERCHLVGVYALGKCQRLMCLLREAGYDQPLYLHGGLQGLTDLYARLGVPVGPYMGIAGMVPAQLRGGIVLCPPSAIADRWSRRLPEPMPAMASGWMQIRARARQRGVELPLVLSDHADWDELMQTMVDVKAPEIWVTHGSEEGLVHALKSQGRHARALALIGRDEEET